MTLCVSSGVARRVIFAAAVAIVFFASALSVHAATTVNALTATPSTVSYGLTTALAWTITEGGGASFLLECPDGVTATKDGTAFPCGTATALSADNSGSAAFKFTNLTGSPAKVVARLTPKNAGGTLVSDAASTVLISVLSVPQPLTEFKAEKMVLESEETVSFSWKGVGISHANMQFTCVAGIKIFSSSGVEIPCGVKAFATDLSGTGSTEVKFVNTSTGAVEVQASMLPAVKSGMYDATHALTQVLSVRPKAVIPPASLEGFTVSLTDVHPHEAITVEWKAAHAKGVQLIVHCELSISILLQGSTTRPCGENLYSTALPAVGSTTIALQYVGFAQQTVELRILVQNADGSFIYAPFKHLITVYPKGFAKQGFSPFKPHAAVETVLENLVAVADAESKTQKLASAVATSTLPESTLSPLQLLSQKLAKGEPVGQVLGASTSRTEEMSGGMLTVSLWRGSLHEQVNLLQEFLMQDSVLYSAGITGFFGPKTEAAIKAFQEMHNIAFPEGPGYGIVGPITRAKLNELFAK